MQPLHIEGTELLDSLVTGIILLDPGYHVTYLNAAAQTLLALSPNQALGRRITDLSRGAETLHQRTFGKQMAEIGGKARHGVSS